MPTTNSEIKIVAVLTTIIGVTYSAFYVGIPSTLPLTVAEPREIIVDGWSALAALRNADPCSAPETYEFDTRDPDTAKDPVQGADVWISKRLSCEKERLQLSVGFYSSDYLAHYKFIRWKMLYGSEVLYQSADTRFSSIVLRNIDRHEPGSDWSNLCNVVFHAGNYVFYYHLNVKRAHKLNCARTAKRDLSVLLVHLDQSLSRIMDSGK